MKWLLIFGISLIAVTSAQVVSPPPADHDGQPGCGVRYEFTRLWRNNFNNGLYWRCEQWRVPARSVQCPSATWFQDSWQTCVPFHKWQWTPYSDPPTHPGSRPSEECEELVIEGPDECIPVTTPPPTIVDTTTSPASPTPPIVTTPETTPPTTPSTTPVTTPETTPTTEDPCPCNPTTTAPTTTTPVPCPCEVTTETTQTPTTIGTIPLESSTQETTTQQAIIECVGATPEQHSPGSDACLDPPPLADCNITTVTRRLPTRNPYVFFECTFNQGWVERRCLLANCFSAAWSQCVAPRLWNNSCRS